MTERVPVSLNCTAVTKIGLQEFLQKNRLDSFSCLQSALAHWVIYLFGLLFITASMDDTSTIIISSWSEIPEIIVVFLTRPGLFVINRSKMALCLVGSKTS